MNYLQFDFEVEQGEQQEKLVALLSHQGFEGFEEQAQCLKAFIEQSQFKQDEFSQVIDLFEELVYQRYVVENINWNKQWEEGFQPVQVNDFVGIRATFHAPMSEVVHEIIITPKMSFGTGHHATTFLMIQQMQALDFVGKSVLDFGTGTGVLAILASKLGASDVFAIDYDEWSITNTHENIEQNACSNIRVAQLDAIPEGQKFTVILANINLNVILPNFKSIVSASSSGAYILLSGFLIENERIVIDSLSQAGLEHVTTLQRGGWILVLAKMPNG
jgi:ribosomal protein L11 methyltransferase